MPESMNPVGVPFHGVSLSTPTFHVNQITGREGVSNPTQIALET